MKNNFPSTMYLFHENKEGFPIIFPLLWQFTLMRKLVTAHVHRYFKAVCVQIAEVIHTFNNKKQVLVSNEYLAKYFNV